MKIYHAWANKIYTEFNLHTPASHLHVLTPHGDISLYFQQHLVLNPKKINAFLAKHSALETLKMQNNIINLFLTPSWWWQELCQIYAEKKYLKTPPLKLPITTLKEKAVYIRQTIQEIKKQSQQLFQQDLLKRTTFPPLQEHLTTSTETAMIKLCAVYGQTSNIRRKRFMYAQLIEAFFTWWKETQELGNIMRFMNPKAIDHTTQRLWILHSLGVALQHEG